VPEAVKDVTAKTVAGQPSRSRTGRAFAVDAYPSSNVTTTERRGSVPSARRRSASANVKPW